jgi:hypothetical protein
MSHIKGFLLRAGRRRGLKTPEQLEILASVAADPSSSFAVDLLVIEPPSRFDGLVPAGSSLRGRGWSGGGAGCNLRALPGGMRLTQFG